MSKNNIQESKQGLKSKKLFDIVKSHGGFAEKTPSFYLNDITDDDVIGIVDGSILDFLKKSYLDKRIQWAQKQGYIVNKGDNVEVIPLKDFTWVAIIERGGNLGNKEYLQTKIGNLKNDRYKNTLNRGDRQYQWSDTGKWGSPKAEEFFMRRTQNDIANQRRARYGNDAVYKVNESVLDGLNKIATTTDMRRFTEKVIKNLYKTSQPHTSHRFRDNDWSALRSFVNILREVDGVKELNLSGTGPYKQSQEGAYKEYKVDIDTTLGTKIEGFIRCHFCGSQEDPWEAYDMTVGFWKNNDKNNINENNMPKVVISENDIKKMVLATIAKVLNEGQGYAVFKSAIKGKSDQMLNNKEARQNFINTGDVRGERPGVENKYYDETSPTYSSQYSWGTSLDGSPVDYVNKSKFGKLGRRAGVAGARMVNALKNKK